MMHAVRKLILTLLAASSMALGQDVEILAPRYEAEALELACAEFEQPCGELPAPRIIFTDVKLKFEALAVFVPIRPYAVLLDVQYIPHLGDSPHPLVYSIYLHETVHYVQWHVHPWTNSEICDTEAHAWRVSNAWLVANGYSEYARWNWRAQYPHCQEGL